MHLLQTTSATLDDIVEPLDLGQPPGDILILSFADSDLAGLAAAYAAEKDRRPSVRLAHLRDLRHPMSIDLWIDKSACHAKVILGLTNPIQQSEAAERVIKEGLNVRQAEGLIAKLQSRGDAKKTAKTPRATDAHAGTRLASRSVRGFDEAAVQLGHTLRVPECSR